MGSLKYSMCQVHVHTLRARSNGNCFKKKLCFCFLDCIRLDVWSECKFSSPLCRPHSHMCTTSYAMLGPCLPAWGYTGVSCISVQAISLDGAAAWTQLLLPVWHMGSEQALYEFGVMHPHRCQIGSHDMNGTPCMGMPGTSVQVNMVYAVVSLCEQGLTL